MGYDNIHLAKGADPCRLPDHGPIWCDDDPHREQPTQAPPTERRLPTEPSSNAHQAAQSPGPIEAQKSSKSPIPAPAPLPGNPLPPPALPEQPKPAWTDLNLTPQDRLAQAAVSLIEQMAFSDIEKVPGKTKGSLTLTPNGAVQFETADGYRGIINTEIARKTGDHLGQTITRISDAGGSEIEQIDERWAGNSFGNNAEKEIHVFDRDGKEHVRMKGTSIPITTAFNSNSAKFRDETASYVEYEGQQQKIQFQFSAVKKGNGVLDIQATISYMDEYGNPTYENGKPKSSDLVELIMNVDPIKNVASVEFGKRKGAPPPDPMPNFWNKF